ncbi:MAG: transglutaminase family protein [Brumimicrobium sp.]|nr:transglutaminase family protein [Brumimicrobium sp.]
MRINTSINALVELIDDPDEGIATHVHSKIVEQGCAALPQLEKLQNRYLDNPAKSERLAKIIHYIEFQNLKADLKRWIDSEDKNLLEGVFLVCKYQYPELTIDALNKSLLTIKKDIWIEINPRQTSFEQVKIFNKIFFDHFDFKRTNLAEQSPHDFFINAVLQSREGSETALGLIYSIIGQSLDLPIYGVSVIEPSPSFILAFQDRNNILEMLNWGINNNGVLFYISVSNRGIIVDPKRLMRIFRSRNMHLAKEQFEPTPNTVVVKHYLIEIADCCKNIPHFRYKIDELNELIALF